VNIATDADEKADISEYQSHFFQQEICENQSP